MLKKKAVTNNDRLMQRTGLMIVYAWVLLAVGFFILTAWDPSYLESSEDYVSILAIIGGPALLIVTKIIDSWNQEKQAQLNDYESQATHERAMDEIVTRHKADMERNPHVEAIVQAKTDGVQDNRIQSLESDLADAISEIVLLREEISKPKKTKKGE